MLSSFWFTFSRKLGTNCLVHSEQSRSLRSQFGAVIWISMPWVWWAALRLLRIILSWFYYWRSCVQRNPAVLGKQGQLAILTNLKKFLLVGQLGAVPVLCHVRLFLSFTYFNSNCVLYLASVFVVRMSPLPLYFLSLPMSLLSYLNAIPTSETWNISLL